MADPHIQSPMDFWDYVTVVLYRCGFAVAAVMLVLLPYQAKIAQIGLLCAGVMLASSLHIYIKHFRLLFQFALWIGLLCQILGLPLLALGACFFTLGGLCYKEYVCFRVFALNWQPVLLMLLWLSLVTGISLLEQVLSVICATLTLILCWQKWQMPMHFDIGDKSKYQI